MMLNQLERAVLGRFIADPELPLTVWTMNCDAMRVTNRSLTGSGFLAEMDRSTATKLFAEDVSLRWGKIGALLNGSQIETGFVVYVDSGYITCIEGYAYDGVWPDLVDKFELYGLNLGSPLKRMGG